MIIYEVIGNPVPWAASRTNGKFHYNPKHKEQLEVILKLKAQFNHLPINTAMKMDVTFYMPIPKSISEKKKYEMLSGRVHHIKKPDRTNMLKFIEDCFEKAGIISNDSHIVGGESMKIYGLVPKTIIRIQPLD